MTVVLCAVEQVNGTEVAHFGASLLECLAKDSPGMSCTLAKRLLSPDVQARECALCHRYVPVFILQHPASTGMESTDNTGIQDCVEHSSPGCIEVVCLVIKHGAVLGLMIPFVMCSQDVLVFCF